MPTVATVVLLSAVVLGQIDTQVDIPDLPDSKIGEVTGTLEPLPAVRTLAARCSAYVAGPGARTRTGTIPRWGTVAVDPTVIALGSRMTIEGFPGNTFVAEDTGGLVRGAHVDLYFESYQAAVQYGVRPCLVSIQI